MTTLGTKGCIDLRTKPNSVHFQRNYSFCFQNPTQLSYRNCDKYSFRSCFQTRAFVQRRSISTRSVASKAPILCAKKGGRNRTVHKNCKCNLCSRTFSTELQFAMHVFTKKHLTKVRQQSLGVAMKELEPITKAELKVVFAQEVKRNPQLFELKEQHEKRMRQRRQKILELSRKYPAESNFFKFQEDLGFFCWEPKDDDLSYERSDERWEVPIHRWMNDNPDKLHEVQDMVIARPPPLLTIPPLPFTLAPSPSASKSRKGFIAPKGFPFSPPPFLPLLASRSKGYDLTGLDVVTSCMALRIIGAASGSGKRNQVRVQRYRHLLLLHWELPFTSELMDPGFQFERALTGRSTDKPQESLDYTFTARVGEIGPLRVLCCGEVDASDENGRAVEIKSNPKAIESADVKMQLMLLGVKKTAVIQSKRRAKDKFTEVCRIQTHDMDSTETVIYAASEEGASDLESCEFMGNTATKSLDLEGEGEGDEEDPLQGVGAKGLRIRYVLDWLRTRPELMGDDPTDQPSTSRPFNLSFDEIGNPVLTRTVERYLPREDLCEEMFGECFRHEYASSEQ